MASGKRRRFGNVRKRASGRWQARYIGPDNIERTAPHTFATEREAAKWLTVIESEIIKGERSPPEAGEVELGEYAERWIAERKLAPRTRELYEDLFRINIKPYLAKLTLDAIKPATIRTWRKRLLDDRRPEPQAVKAYCLLRAILGTAAKEDGVIRENPCRIKGYDTYHTPERPTATVAQVYALAKEMPARFSALVIVAAFSGLRWGELAALRRCDVDLQAGTVRVPRKLAALRGGLEFGAPKSDAGLRTVALPAAAVAALRPHMLVHVAAELEALVFTGAKGKVLRTGNFRRAVRWAAAVKAAGIVGEFHFHDLRHTGNTLAAASGASTRELMHRMGHSSMRAALIYQHATSERDREIAEGMDKRIADQTGKKPPRQAEASQEARRRRRRPGRRSGPARLMAREWPARSKAPETRKPRCGRSGRTPGLSSRERATGIEPAPSVWKTEALPLSYARAAPSVPNERPNPRHRPPARPPLGAGRQARAETAYTSPRHGVWRSLVAHSLWERGAVGSNPATPTDVARLPSWADARANAPRAGSPRLCAALARPSPDEKT
jgi:integrase